MLTFCFTCFTCLICFICFTCIDCNKSAFCDCDGNQHTQTSKDTGDCWLPVPRGRACVYPLGSFSVSRHPCSRGASCRYSIVQHYIQLYSGLGHKMVLWHQGAIPDARVFLVSSMAKCKEKRWSIMVSYASFPSFVPNLRPCL